MVLVVKVGPPSTEKQQSVFVDAANNSFLFNYHSWVFRQFGYQDQGLFGESNAVR